jgi:prephenate dehydrogenase
LKISSLHTIGIIGGRGRTGGQFANLFRKAGFSVETTGSKNKFDNRKLIKNCDIVIFALPLDRAAEIIRMEASRARRKDQLLLDLSSLKIRETQAMLRSKGEVIGMHPLFGPTTDARRELVILCPVRAKRETVESLRSILRKMGLQTALMTPGAHDELMAIVQVIPHLKSFLMAEVLRGLKVKFQHVLRNCTPTYELEFNVIGRFLDDNPSLYMPIIFRNPLTPRILRAMRKNIDAYLSIARKKRLPSAMRRYKKAKEFFAPFTGRAREHSEACIRTLTSLTR